MVSSLRPVVFIITLFVVLYWIVMGSSDIPVSEAQGGDQVTLLSVDTYYGVLYAIDSQTGALAPLVQSLPAVASGKIVNRITVIPGTREVLMAVDSRSPSDPSSIIRVDLDRVKYAPLFYQTIVSNLDGAASVAVRSDGVLALIPEFRANLRTDGDYPIREINLQTGATRVLTMIPKLYQPWALLYTPTSRLFLAAGNTPNCSLFELNPTTGQQLQRWPIVCEPPSGRAIGLTFDSTTGDILIGDGELYLSRFNPDHDNQPRVWTTWPRAFSDMKVDTQGILYTPSYAGSGQGFGILRMAVDKTARWLLPPGSTRAGSLDLTNWQAVEFFVGPRPATLRPMATFTPTPIRDTPTATQALTSTPRPTSRAGQIDIVLTPSPQQVGYFSTVHGRQLGGDTVFSGVLDGQDLYDGVIQFDLPDVPFESNIVGAAIRLTGKNDTWLNPTQPASWILYALLPSTNVNLNAMTYPDFHNSRSTGGPLIWQHYQLGADRNNEAQFPEGMFDIFRRSQQPSGKVTFRINGPQGGFIPNHLFGWYSGVTPADTTKAPRLILSYVVPITLTPTPSPTETPTVTLTPDLSETATPTPTSTATDTPTPPSTMTPTPSSTVVVEPSSTPTPTFSVTPSPTPIVTETPHPTVTPTETSLPTDTPTPTPTPIADLYRIYLPYLLAAEQG